MFRVCIGLFLALCLARESEGSELGQIQSLMNQQNYVQAFRLGQKLEYRLANSSKYNQMMIQLATYLNHPEEAFFAFSRLRLMAGDGFESERVSVGFGSLATENFAGIGLLSSSSHSR